jgi:hypothetical protein
MKDPNIKIQDPEKHQAPIIKDSRRSIFAMSKKTERQAIHCSSNESWRLKFGISLEFGCWFLELP